MFKTRVLAQRIFLCIFFVISNVEKHEKIAFLKIKKKCSAGAKYRARWDQNHLIFFTWPNQHTCSCIVGGVQDERHDVFDCDFTRAFLE